MSEWNCIPLSELIASGRTISYGIVQPGSHQENGVPILRVSDIRNGRIAMEEPMRVSSQIEAAHARTRLRGGELLLTLVGTVGEVAVVPPELEGWNVARAVAVIPVREDIGAYWVKLALSAPNVREMIHGRMNTTVQATLNLKDVAQLPILMPDADERSVISDMIGAVDNKIELNLRMNETLEAMARAIFQSWFVDFDPVRAKASGESVDSICSRLGLTPKLLALFPASFEDLELGEIPAGWSVRGLDGVAKYLNGLALQKYPAVEGLPWLPVIKIAQLRAGHSLSADRANTEVPAAYVIEDGDILFSWSGSLEVEIWCGGKGALNQHLFKVTSDEFPKWFYFVWTRHHLNTFRDIAANKATTMGHIQRKHLTEAKVVCPPTRLIEEMTERFSPLVEKMINCRLENAQLVNTRNALLPQLLSGELAVSGVEV